jgi:TonB family protein
MKISNLVFCLGLALGAAAPAVAAPQSEPLRISSIVMQAKLTHSVPPKYPEAARKKDVQGTVKMQVLIAKNGAVKSVKVVAGDKQLAKAAIAAVKQWRYQTTLLNGKPVAVETEVDVKFALTKPPKPTPKSTSHP